MEKFKIPDLKITPSYLETLAKKSYQEDRKYPENFSNWFPHIKTTGAFNTVNIISNQIFTFEEIKIFQETDNIEKVNWNKLNQILKPTLNKMKPGYLYNIKNGCFSNKFDFDTCIASTYNLAQQLWKINYNSHLYDTGGYTELVVRDLLPIHLKDDLFIYNGLPLRYEVRVFYNLDKEKIEYITDYWNFDYCKSNLNATDYIVFKHFHDQEEYNIMLEMIINTISEEIHTLKFDKTLKGIWSIDFLYNKDDNEIYLIDMARGFRSAYWDLKKIRKE